MQNKNYNNYIIRDSKLKFSINTTNIDFKKEFFDKMSDKIAKSLDELKNIENGKIANQDENRMVGHY